MFLVCKRGTHRSTILTQQLLPVLCQAEQPQPKQALQHQHQRPQPSRQVLPTSLSQQCEPMAGQLQPSCTPSPTHNRYVSSIVARAPSTMASTPTSTAPCTCQSALSPMAPISAAAFKPTSNLRTPTPSAYGPRLACCSKYGRRRPSSPPSRLPNQPTYLSCSLPQTI